jgi:hypothetical protein
MSYIEPQRSNGSADTSPVVNSSGSDDIVSIKPDPMPDWSQVRPLIEQLLKVASGHGGTFLVSTVGSEDPETGIALGAYHFHTQNDEDALKQLSLSIEAIATGGTQGGRGYNCYVGIQLMRPGLTTRQKGREGDVIGVFAAVVDFDGKHHPETRDERLPLFPHAEVETSPGQFQCWYFFDRPYPVADAKPVLTALARCTGSDHTQSCDHVFRVPGTLNWPTRKKIEGGRSRVPYRALMTTEPDGMFGDPIVTLDELRAAIIEKYPNAFDAANISDMGAGVCKTDFDWNKPLRAGGIRPLKDETILKKLARFETDRSASAYGVIRELAGRGYTPNEVRDKLAELYDTGDAVALGHYADNAKGFNAALKADIGRAFTKEFEPDRRPSKVFRAYVPTEDASPQLQRRDIKISGGTLPAMLDEAECALIEQGVDLFQRGDMIVRPGDACDIKIRHGEKASGKRLFEVTAIEMREHMTAAASFVQWDGRKQDYKRIDCPEMVAAGYLARKGRRNLRTLTALIDAPTMRLDGTIHERPGYDEATGLYLIPTIEFPTIPAEPSRTDAIEATAVLKMLVQDFPFVTDADRSVWLSAMLTAPIRAMLSTAPLHGFDAPVPGSGKGKLVDTVAMVATGRPASVFNQGRSEEETEKRVGSILMTGDLCINMDNCTLPLEGDFLCSALTAAGAVRVRILGRSEAPQLRMVATLFATGNNLTAKGDMTRRMIRCTIDPKMERPETRKFDNDPVDDAQQGRPNYLAAALTILRAHAVADRPQCDLAPLGSFEQWSRVVRAALVWLGEADPCDTMKDIAGDDEEHETLATLIDAWHEAHGTEAMAVAAAAEKLTPDILRKVAPSPRGEGYDARRFGWYLKHHARKVANGRRLVQTKSGNNSLWRVEVIH